MESKKPSLGLGVVLVVIVTILLTLTSSFQYTSISEGVIWWLCINLAVLLPVFLFRNIWLKLLAIPFYFVLSYYLTLSLGLELEVIGVFFLYWISIPVLIAVICAGHYRSKKSYTWLAGVALCVLVVVAGFGFMSKRYSDTNKKLNDIRSGKYSSVDDALKACGDFKKEEQKNSCFRGIAVNETRSDLCERIVEVPGDQYPRAEYVAACKKEIINKQTEVYFSVANDGGHCLYGMCSSEIKITYDGGYTYRMGTKTTTGKFLSADFAALTKAVSAVDFRESHLKPFTGTCPIAYDGYETTYTFHHANGKVLKSCTYDIDLSTHPFKTITEILSKIYSQ